jgi:hypothetical protein
MGAETVTNWAQSLGMNQPNDQFDFGMPGHPCSICQSERQHTHAYRPGTDLKDAIAKSREDFDREWEAMLKGLPRKELESYRRDRHRSRRRLIRELKDKGLLGWAHSQRIWTYDEKMGNERGRYPTGRQLAGHDLSWKVYDSSEDDEDNGAADYRAPHETHKPDFPDEGVTTGIAIHVSTPSSAEFQEGAIARETEKSKGKYLSFRRINQDRIRVYTAPELYTFSRVFGGKHGIIRHVSAAAYDELEHNQRGISLARVWTDQRMPVQTLIRREWVEAWDKISALWRTDFAIPKLFAPDYNPLLCGFVYEDAPRHFAAEAAEVEYREPDAEHLYDSVETDIERFRREKGYELNKIDDVETTIKSDTFAGIKKLFDQFVKSEGKKRWRGHTPWWRAIPAYPVSGPNPLWPGSHVLYPICKNDDSRKSDMQLVWLGSENGYTLLGWEHREPWQRLTKKIFDVGIIHREPWEPVDGLIWTERWSEPYCVTCGHYITQIDHPAHDGHNVYEKPQVRSYGHSILYPWGKDFERLIPITHIDEEKWRTMVEHERKDMAERLNAAEKLRDYDLTNSKYTLQIILDVFLKRISEKDAAKLLHVSINALKSEVSRIRNAKVEDFDELWNRLLEGKEPGIYAIANLDRKGPRAYRIAGADEDEVHVWHGFNKVITDLIRGQKYKKRIPPINGDADLYRKRAIERGCDPLSNKQLAIQMERWKLAQQLTARMWRSWPDLAPATAAWWAECSSSWQIFIETGIPA